jgi:hypothetical protein
LATAVGACTVQLDDNLGALAVELAAEQLAMLERVSA